MSIELITGMSGAPHISSEDVRESNKAIYGNGAFILVGCGAQITSPNSVHISPGLLYIGGAFIRITGNGEDAIIENGVSGRVRTDAICVHYTRSETGIEQTVIDVYRGADVATGSTPPVPSPVGSMLNNYSNAQNILYLVDVTVSGLENLRSFGVTIGKPIFSFEDGVLSVAKGGTGRAGFTNRNILVGNQNGGINQLAPTLGALYVPNDGDFPRYGTLPIKAGGTGGATEEEARAKLGLDDTGWQTLSSGTSWFVEYRRIGKLVEVRGESAGTKNLTAGGNNPTYLGKLPADCIPSELNGSTYSKFLAGQIGLMGSEGNFASELIIHGSSSSSYRELYAYVSVAVKYWHFNFMYFV